MTTESDNEPLTLASPIKAIAVATVLAGVLLVLVVLPAEFNIDPTGFGGMIGVTVLSSPGGSSDTATSAVSGTETPTGKQREDGIVIDIPAGKGVEYKVQVRAGEKLTYRWKSAAGVLFYDFHGEPKGAAKNVFESFAVGRGTLVKGTFTAPFEGTHGWYWKNSGRKPVKVSLTLSGSYEIIENR
jgi:hypothetical protein